MGAHDCGDAEIARDNRAVRKDAAALDDKGARVDEQRRPAGIGRWAYEDVIAPEIGDLAGIENDPRRARGSSRGDGVALPLRRNGYASCVTHLAGTSRPSLRPYADGQRSLG